VADAATPHRLHASRPGQHARAEGERTEESHPAAGAPDTIFIVDGQGVLLEHITGDGKSNPTSLAGRQLEDVLPAEVARAARQSVSGTHSGELATYEFAIGRGKQQQSFEARLRPQADGTLLIVTRDTTERRRAKARIEYLAYYDTLTGLPNRQLFVRDVGRAIRAAKRTGHIMALLYLDLDRFKRINDNLGYSVGDALLQNGARRLDQSTRPSDVVAQPGDPPQTQQARVARLGGDEFVVLLTGLTAEEQTTIVANRIQQALGEPFDCRGHRFVVTPSIGIAAFKPAIIPYGVQVRPQLFLSATR
jgi:GGDEF domain-containing protein